MKLDLDSGAYIQIGGELGKYNSLPIDTLIKIAQDLQELVMTIAKFDLPSSEIVNLDNFKIELVDFKKGSAVPKFAFTPRIENKVGQNWKIHRKVVSDKFEKLVEISDSGDYKKLIELYPEPVRRNPIIENLYSFVNDFGTAPVSFVNIDVKTEKITPVFKINRFKPALKKELLTEIKNIPKIAGESKYILKYPLRCLFEKEDGFFIIQSEMLCIIGTGLTEDEAEKTFAEEFDFVYQRFNSLDGKSLTNHNQLIKDILNQIVEKIER